MNFPASQSKHITAGPAETIENPPPPVAQTLSSPQTRRSQQPGTHSQQPKDHGKRLHQTRSVSCKL